MYVYEIHAKEATMYSFLKLLIIIINMVAKFTYSSTE